MACVSRAGAPAVAPRALLPFPEARWTRCRSLRHRGRRRQCSRRTPRTSGMNRRVGGRPAATCAWGVRSVSQRRRRSRCFTGRPVGRTDEFGTCGPSKTAACSPTPSRAGGGDALVTHLVPAHPLLANPSPNLSVSPLPADAVRDAHFCVGRVPIRTGQRPHARFPIADRAAEGRTRTQLSSDIRARTAPATSGH
jgi:hypothetical protein